MRRPAGPLAHIPDRGPTPSAAAPPQGPVPPAPGAGVVLLQEQVRPHARRGPVPPAPGAGRSCAWPALPGRRRACAGPPTPRPPSSQSRAAAPRSAPRSRRAPPPRSSPRPHRGAQRAANYGRRLAECGMLPALPGPRHSTAGRPALGLAARGAPAPGIRPPAAIGRAGPRSPARRAAVPMRIARGLPAHRAGACGRGAPVCRSI